MKKEQMKEPVPTDVVAGMKVAAGDMTITLEAVGYHRNGMTGRSFHAVTFWYEDEHDERHALLATVFAAPGAVAVLDRELARVGDVDFSRDSTWRGDRFEPALRAAIKLWGERRGAVLFPKKGGAR